MSRKKPLPPLPRPGTQPPSPRTGPAANPRLQAANRWQRTKRYGWDGR